MKKFPVVFAGAAIASTWLHGQAETQLNVGVRSQLDWQKNTQNGKVWDGTHLKKLPDAPEHSKLYGILAFQRVTEYSSKLVKPVDETALKAELIRQLDSHGFTHAGPKHRPEILLTVYYGRGWLPNPYYSKDINVDNMEAGLPSNPFDPSKPQVQMNDPRVAARLAERGVERDATRSQFEKLFIMVRAWKNPTEPKEKREILWVCTVVVDDPDHHDLNLIAKQMLEAGAPFFDKEIKGEEAEIMKPLREAQVTIGTPTVVDPAKTK